MTTAVYEWVTNNNTSTGSNPIRSTTAEKEEHEEEEKARCEWDFQLRTVVSPTTTTIRESSDILGVVEFDPSDQLLATGGIARKIRIYTLASLLGREEENCGCSATVTTAETFTDNASACSYYICTPAKLSSLRWKPDSGSRFIGSGDYDGVVNEYDLERHVPVFERDEHGGRRVWSLDYSRSSSPNLAASGSDDGTTHLWDTRTAAGCGIIQPGLSKMPVCSVEFDPLGGSLIGLGSADKRAYVYDLRFLSKSVCTLSGHQRTVAYVRFLGNGTTMVTAGIDGCLKTWDLTEAKELRTYKGHVNTRNFVGLSVWRNSGLLSCGSESNEVYVYDMRWSEPIAVQRFGKWDEQELGFVSSVCWRQTGEDDCMIVAGGSNGVLQVSVGRRKPLMCSNSPS